MLSWQSLIKNRRGFSLTEVMVGGAILAGIGLAGARLFKDQRQSQARLDYEQELQIFHQNLTKFIQDEKNCNATFTDWLGRTPAQVAISGTTEFWTCSNCGTTLGFNYDMSSVARGTRFLQIPTWIENINGITTKEKGLWRINTPIMFKPGYAQPTGTGTFMLQVTYEMDPAFPGSRAVKKMSVKKDISLNLRFTQHTNPANRYLRECLSPKESAVNNLQSDICNSMTMVASTGNIMTWRDGTQSCDLLGTTPGSPVKTCPGGMVVAGIQADGTVHCEMLNQGVAPAADLSVATPCSPTAQVKLEWDPVTKKMRAACY